MNKRRATPNRNRAAWREDNAVGFVTNVANVLARALANLRDADHRRRNKVKPASASRDRLAGSGMRVMKPRISPPVNDDE